MIVHTPGPWTPVECDGNADDIAITVSDGGYVCYSVATEADAMLIAAAPDLLSALKAHLPWDEDYGPVQGWGIWQDAVDAINKAEGRLGQCQPTVE